MRVFKKIILLILFLIGCTYPIAPVLGAGDYVTVKNDTGATVSEGGTIQIEGVFAYNQTSNVKVYYNIYDSDNALKSANNSIQTNVSNGTEQSYTANITANRSVFTKKGLYTIEVHFDTTSGTAIDTAKFKIFVDIADKPKQPTFSASPTPPSLANTVNVTISQGVGENSAFLPLTIQYRQSIYDNWTPYSTPIPVTANESYIYARACTSGGQCSTVGTYQVTNVNTPASTPATNKTAPTVYKEESKVATYYFVGFQKSESTKIVPVPSGTTPSN